MISFSNERIRLRRAIAQIDRQTAWVLISAGLLVFLHRAIGSRMFFREYLVDLFPEYWQGVLAWTWWFAIKGVVGFIIPVAILVLIFNRRPRDIGLGLGDLRFARVVLLVYVPIVAVGTWILSADGDFQSSYPHYRGAANDWTLLLVYEASYLLYWVGWEYLWRGFVLFGTAPAFGVGAIVIQMVPFALLHAGKPATEAYLSILGGLALGVLVWRCRSFWIAVPIHAFQMLMLDYWCTLRARSGSEGIGLDALVEAFGGIAG